MGSIEDGDQQDHGCSGAYSLAYHHVVHQVAVRDPRGYRPLCASVLPGGYVFASESCALDAAGATLLRDVEPGEIGGRPQRGELRSIKDHCGRKDTQMCVFEYIYFSRPDSIIGGCSVHEARNRRAGLAQASWRPMWSSARRIPVWTPRWATPRRAASLRAVGFIKNKYIGTFIQGSQKRRRTACAR